MDPTLEHAGGMKLSDLSANKCVMSTSDASGGVMAWEGDGEIFVARTDGPNKQTIPAGQGKNPKHPRVARTGGQTLVTWTENTGWNKGGSVAWVILDDTLRPIEGTLGHAKDLPVWGYPAAFATPAGGFVILY
jgi:hypothetical protein